MTAETLLLAVGFLAGWWCGIRYAEMGRARVDARKLWQGRSSWRR